MRITCMLNRPIIASRKATVSGVQAVDLLLGGRIDRNVLPLEWTEGRHGGDMETRRNMTWRRTHSAENERFKFSIGTRREITY